MRSDDRPFVVTLAKKHALYQIKNCTLNEKNIPKIQWYIILSQIRIAKREHFTKRIPKLQIHQIAGESFPII